MVEKIPPKKIKEIKLRAYRWGIVAEYMAIIMLTFRGYKFLRRRYRNVYGEVDLVMRKDTLIVFVEVKGRKTRDEAAYSVQPRQKVRIEKAAMGFMQANKRYEGHDIRFDVVCCVPWSMPQHIEHAWDVVL